MADIKAVIFDFNGVLERHGEVDDALIEYIASELKTVTTAVFTRMDSQLLKVMLMRFKPHPFDELFTVDTVDALKPHPDAFREVATRLNLSPDQCVMIDDSTYNVAGANEAGMHGIYYQGTEALKAELELVI